MHRVMAALVVPTPAHTAFVHAQPVVDEIDLVLRERTVHPRRVPQRVEIHGGSAGVVGECISARNRASCISPVVELPGIDWLDVLVKPRGALDQQLARSTLARVMYSYSLR